LVALYIKHFKTYKFEQIAKVSTWHNQLDKMLCFIF